MISANAILYGIMAIGAIVILRWEQKGGREPAVPKLALASGLALILAVTYSSVECLVAGDYLASALAGVVVLLTASDAAKVNRQIDRQRET